MVTVNVTCVACDGNPPCAECRAAGQALTEAGHRVQHSSRSAALRAALAGTYGFEACVVPVKAGEHAVADAAEALFDTASVALAVADTATVPTDLPTRFRVITLDAFRAGDLPKDWPPRVPSAESAGRLPTDSIRDEDHATRRLRSALLRARGRTKGGARADVADARGLIADEIAWAKASGSVFSIVLTYVQRGDDALTRRLLAAALRDIDIIGRHDGAYVAVLAGAGPRAAGAVAKRLRSAMTGAKTQIRAGLGVASFPEDGDDAATLLAHAAKRASGS